jgi:succinate dehydrogenase / fumarate reductase iron-sulfur subunit
MSLKSGPTEGLQFEVFRYDASRDEPPRIDRYDFPAGENISVLEALLRIRDEQDPTLAFRYACRGAVCGSCAMSINGRLGLACRVQLRHLHARRIVIEPLPNFEVVKDLVVDMDPFWEKYERVQPWLHATIGGDKESRMSDAQLSKIDQYVNCILCGLCMGACPVLASNPAFTGPAALSKLYRFLEDAREDRSTETLEAEDRHEGAWGCHTITRCIAACPKGVRPTDGIEGLRRKLIKHRLKKVASLGRGPRPDAQPVPAEAPQRREVPT